MTKEEAMLKYPGLEIIAGDGEDAYREGEPIVERSPLAVVIEHPTEEKYLLAKWRNGWVGLLTGGVEPGDDAKTILAALEEAGLRNRVKVIGMSRDTIEGVDVNIYKSMSDEILKSKLDGAILDLFPTPLKLEKPKKKALKQRFTKPAKR